MVSIYQKKLTPERKLLVYQKTNGICIICQKQVSKNHKTWSVEHYIPRAVYKWVPKKEVRDIVESLDNLFIVHKQCNHNKDAELPTKKSILDLPINQALKKDVLAMYQNIGPEITLYRRIKQRVLSSQQYQCFFCQRKIHLPNCTLRRKDNQQGRVVDNAMCLCFRCSVRAGREAYKRKMVDKRTS